MTVNPQTGRTETALKGRERVGTRNHQCPICKYDKECSRIYSQDMWNDDGSCPEYTKKKE